MMLTPDNTSRTSVRSALAGTVAFGLMVSAALSPALAQNADETIDRLAHPGTFSLLGPDTVTMEIDFTVTAGDGAEEDGYLYLTDTEGATLTVDTVADELRIFSVRSASASLETTGAGTLDTRSRDAFIGLGLGRERGKGFGIGVSSRLEEKGGDLGSLFDDDQMAALSGSRAYSMGLALAYSGFNVGASFVREDTGMFGAVEGYDIGFAYIGSSWSTSLMFGEYAEAESQYDLGLTEGRNNREFYAVEFGASYRLNPALRFSGGLRFFDYRNSFGLDPMAAESGGSFYLGTNFNF